MRGLPFCSCPCCAWPCRCEGNAALYRAPVRGRGGCAEHNAHGGPAGARLPGGIWHGRAAAKHQGKAQVGRHSDTCHSCKAGTRDRPALRCACAVHMHVEGINQGMGFNCCAEVVLALLCCWLCCCCRTTTSNGGGYGSGRNSYAGSMDPLSGSLPGSGRSSYAGAVTACSSCCWCPPSIGRSWLTPLGVNHSCHKTVTHLVLVFPVGPLPDIVCTPCAPCAVCVCAAHLQAL